MRKRATPTSNNAHAKPEHKQIPEVYVLRDWREYAGESFLIIFSVLLALVLTEFINNLHDKKETRDMLENVRNELVTNKHNEELQLAYHLKVIKVIDSALVSPELQKQIVSGDEFHLTRIAPDGVLFRFLSSVAWDVAKSHNISSRISFKTTAMLTHIYDEQARIMKVEDEIAKVFLSREAGKIENAHATLILIKNNYKGWAVDRAPGLIKQYDDAIKVLGQNN